MLHLNPTSHFCIPRATFFDMNPYASQLGTQDPIRAFGNCAAAAGTCAIARRLRGLNSRSLPASGVRGRFLFIWRIANWLLDFAIGRRWRRTITPSSLLIRTNGLGLTRPTMPRQALETFTALRRWNLALISKLTPEQMSKGVMHPERGQETFLGLIEISAGHDVNHLRQLEKVAG